MNVRLSLTVLAGSWLSLAACAPALAPAFDTRMDSSAAPAADLGKRLQARATTPSTPALVATTHGQQPAIVLYDLQQGKTRWRVPVAAQTRPELLGDVVLTTVDGQLLGLSAEDGSPRFKRELGDCEYLGAARDADRIVYSCSRGTERGGLLAHATLTALDARSGRTLWRRQADGALGRPAVEAGLVLVPWQQQWLAILDIASGRELRRVRSRDDVIDWVVAQDGLALFGHRRIEPLGSSSEAGQAQQSALLLDGTALPGQPLPYPSAFVSQPGTRSARGRIALHFAPEASDPGVRLARDRYYFVFYRYAFGFDGSGHMLWCRVLPRDVIAGRALGDGLLALLEDGSLVSLDQGSGAVTPHANVGVELAAADLAAVPPSLASQPPSTPPEPPRPLREALREIALDNDARLVPARSYAVARLAALDDPAATLDLLRIYEQPSVPPELARAAADALRVRRSGFEHLLAALRLRYDFLEQTRPAPLQVIVPPLVEGRDKRAVPALLERLLDHETPAAALPTLAHAIVELGDARVVDRLLAWLRLYRADSSFADAPEALLEAARGVALHGGARGRAALIALASEDRPHTPSLPKLREGIAALLEPPAANTPQPAVSAPAVAHEAPPAPPLPDALTPDAVAATFAAHAQPLQACLSAEHERSSEVSQVRMAFIAESDGGTHGLSFVPDRPTLSACLYATLANLRFPAFQRGRQVASFTLGLRDATPVASAPTVVQERPAWWSWYAARAPQQASAPRRPWWRSRQPLAPLVEPPVRETGMAPDASGATAAPPEPAAPTAAPAKSQDDWWVPKPAGSTPAATAAPVTPAPPATPAPPSAPARPADNWWVPQSR